MNPFGIRLQVSDILPAMSSVMMPDVMFCGRRQFRMIQQEIAAGEAERAFAGRDWRRIKREARKARERVK